MKRAASLILALSLALALTACGEKPATAPAPPDDGGEPGAWSSAGRAYRQTPLESRADSLFSVFAQGGDYYEAAMRFGPDGNAYELTKNGETLYAPEGADLDRADGGEAGVWLLLTQRTDSGPQRTLRLISYSGDELLSLTLAELGLGDFQPLSLRCRGDGVVLGGQELVALVDGQGRLAASFPVEAGGELLSGGDGQVYLALSDEKKTEIGLVGESGLSPAMTLPAAGVRLCGGNGEFPLTYISDEGLYGVDDKGAATPLAIWRDCGLTVLNARGVSAMADGAFLIWDSMGLSLLEPADPSDMRPAVTLTLAKVSAGAFGREYGFNALGSGYYVEVRDYSEGGTLSTEDALKRLNTDMIAGNYPDMLLLEGMPVHTYINKGYLAELGELMDADPELGREDIAIASKLAMSGGIYLMGASFGIETRAGLYSRFGDAHGWTLDQYLEIERSLPEGAEMLYNNTRPEFFRSLCAGYAAGAMDWEKGVCDFDNGEFIALLKAVSGIRETPEPEDLSMADFTPSAVRLREGTLCAASYWIGSVTALESLEKRVGERLSLIGMPTPDGSCGSRLVVSDPIGVFSAGTHRNGCWEFIKYLLTSREAGDVTVNSSLPVYAPRLAEQLKLAQSLKGEDGQPLLSAAGAERFLEFLETADAAAVYDETLLGIIEDASAAYFAGDKTAEQTAAQIQSRVSIYIAEQSA